EEGGTGTDLDDYDTTYECSIDGAAGPLGSGSSVDINLTYGDSAVCTFSNSRLPTLEVKKLLDPTGDPGLFDLL
ncbi:MAG: hypothetical protein GTN70_09620, partial [Deltaproteobacteria bacterium]|nr:hypothetical protein [Deltaproteobacteria bacterium]